jgi:hypothetical protein
VREGLTLVSHPLEVYGPSQAKAMLHLCLALKGMPSARRLNSPRRGSLPTDSLDVVIDLDRQLCAAAAAATAQNFATVSSGHSLAETVNTHTAANFGLVCTFRGHSRYLFTVIITKIMPSNYLSGMALYRKVAESKRSF